jgi:hypothetical protein
VSKQRHSGKSASGDGITGVFHLLCYLHAPVVNRGDMKDTQKTGQRLRWRVLCVLYISNVLEMDELYANTVFDVT